MTREERITDTKAWMKLVPKDSSCFIVDLEDALLDARNALLKAEVKQVVKDAVIVMLGGKLDLVKARLKGILEDV